MLTNPIILRRVEALAVFLLGIVVYYYNGYSWLTFAILFFLPDAGAIGYLKSYKFGGSMYNLTHLTIWPLVLVAYGFIFDNETAKMIAIIWITHVMFDRLLGWGFKSGGSFYETGMGSKRDPRKEKA